jgi:hypothetical protein
MLRTSEAAHKAAHWMQGIKKIEEVLTSYLAENHNNLTQRRKGAKTSRIFLRAFASSREAYSLRFDLVADILRIQRARCRHIVRSAHYRARVLKNSQFIISCTKAQQVRVDIDLS